MTVPYRRRRGILSFEAMEGDSFIAMLKSQLFQYGNSSSFGFTADVFHRVTLAAAIRHWFFVWNHCESSFDNERTCLHFNRILSCIVFLISSETHFWAHIQNSVYRFTFCASGLSPLPVATHGPSQSSLTSQHAAESAHCRIALHGGNQYSEKELKN